MANAGDWPANEQKSENYEKCFMEALPRGLDSRNVIFRREWTIAQVTIA